MFLRRREFLIQGCAAAATPAFARTSYATITDASKHSGALTGASMIWSAVTVPVALQAGGSAERIASSSKGVLSDTPPDHHSVFAREIVLPISPESALLHLFTFTRYRLYLNGRYLGRGPCRYQNQRPEYDSRDIARYFQAGRNVLIVLVHRDSPTGRIMLHDPGLIASLEIVANGKRQIVATDSSWMSMPEISFGPRAKAWSSIEEHIDARKTGEWTMPDLSQPVWRPSLIVPGSGEGEFFPRSTPLQVETVRQWSSGNSDLPVELSTGSEVELSLPEIAQAFHVLEMDAEEGTTLEVSYVLPDGESSGKCTYIARAGAQTWMGGDTFAFLRLRLRVLSGKLRLTQSSACEVRYPFAREAAFACSDPSLGQLWAICARSLEVLSEDAYVDCADRERVEWTDVSPPAFDCTRVLMRGPDDAGKAHWGDARLLGGLLRRISLTQQPDGQLKAHSCSERFDIHAIMEDRTCDWIVLLREYVESCGDLDLARESWPVAMRLLDWYRQRSTARGLVLAREWEVWDNPLRYQVCEGAGLNAMVYRALVDAAVVARKIGREGDAVSLAARAQQLHDDYNRLLWNEVEGAYDGALFGAGSEIHPQKGYSIASSIVDGRFPPTAQANLFALYSGVVPSKRIALVRRWILNHLDQVREPMSHYYLFQMLYAMNDRAQDETVLRLMRTGWQNQVDSPWQTTWEDLEKSKGSKVHVYGMHPAYFLTAFVLGARREGPVELRTILIEPRFSGLDWAKGICITEFGPVGIEWRIDAAADQTALSYALPANTQAKLRLPVRDANDMLEIDGVITSAKSTDGWMEAVAPPGRHRVLLRSAPRATSIPA